MAGRFVRNSKFRHVYGNGSKRGECYDNLRISKNAWDTNLVQANPLYISVNWEASGGGAFAVIPLGEKGKLPELMPLFRGHTAAVLDTNWNPFNDDIIASGSDDGKVFVWKVPEDFTLHTDADEPADVKPVGKLSGHSRKVGHVLFNPAAENVLASSSGDFTIKLWDLEDGKSKLTLKHNDIVQSLSWSGDGSMLVTTSRDKKLRFWDVRQEKPAHEVPGHAGAKNSRCVWLGSHDRVATTGFSKMSERQLALWDTRNPGKPIGGDFSPLDASSGVGMPFWDDGTQMFYLAGKGDGNIRYFEFANDKFEDLSEYKSGDPQRGLAFMPKRGINTHENEVMRAYKTVNDAWIEPISFIVPRRSETFQDDIYPATTGLKAGVSSPEWFGGKTAYPPKFSMEDLYEGQEPQQVAAEDVPKPTATRSAPEPAPAAATVAKEAPAERPAPTSATTRELPKVNESKKSMADMASKFADQDEPEEEDEDASSFEVVPRPAERASATQATSKATNGDSTPDTTRSSAAPATSEPEPKSLGVGASGSAMGGAFSGETLASPASSTSKPVSELRQSEQQPPSQSQSQPPSASAAAGGLREVLQEIRGMLQTQSKAIEQLTNEVAQLKAKVGE